jgi:uncharacterized protein (TIGR03435 family)
MTNRSKNFIPAIALLGAILALTISASARAQTSAQMPAQAPQAFEVASIRAVGTDPGPGTFPTFPSAQFTMENMPLTIMISMAYGVSDNRIASKPEWMDSTFFTVKAKPEGDVALTQKQYRPLLQQLLQQRFKLAVHHETRDIQGYALVVSKGGPKLTPAKEKDTGATAYILEDGIRGQSMSIEGLASLLTRPLGQPVLDKTGIEGNYILNLTFAPPNSTESTLPSVFTALQEQLGLKLEPQKVPTDFLVIDHVEKVPTEN